MKDLALVALFSILGILLAIPVPAQEPASEPDGETTTTVVTPDEATAPSFQDSSSPRGFSLHLESVSLTEPQSFDPVGSFSLSSEREFRAALWDAPLGRVHYQLASEQSMLGRQGLVHGGHMLGLGLATTAIGDAPSAGIELMMHGRSWSDLSPSERFRTGFDIAISAGILYAVIQGID